MTMRKKSNTEPKKYEIEMAEEMSKEVESFRIYFRLHEDDEAKKIQAVTKLRDMAISCLRIAISEYLRPLPAKAPRSFSSSIKSEEIYTVERIIKEWDLTAGETYKFLKQIVEYDGLTGSQHSAAYLLHLCIKAIEENAVPDYRQKDILSAFAELDDDELMRYKKHGKLGQEGRNKGGATGKKRAENRITRMKTVVEDILRNPITSDWGDVQIVKHIKNRGLHTIEGVSPIGDRQIKNHIKTIREEFKARYSTS